ncbi:MAG: aminoglycoside phosphotransferase family protein [Ruminococcaceae bacterium]|nr:aminoglycoside phosphotransferase family protein [Oscillospiraceae bacterium]
MSYLNDALKQFGVDAKTVAGGSGHINETYVLDTKPRTILQRVNPTVFKNPDYVMQNIEAVTAYLRERIVEEGGDPLRETLNVVPTVNGEPYYRAPDGSIYRMYYFIEGAKTYDRADTPALFAASAHGFGKFQRMLADFPADTLHEVIEKFHDTGDRLRQFREALEKNASGRADSVRPEIEFVLSRADYVTRVTDALADGSIPVRVTHNDTKLNNVMLDETTNEAICVIDLDTVMPGSMLYDFGDALRFGASTGSEDETDLSKIEFDLTYFEAFTKAFLEEVGHSITPKERELLPFSAILMTLECGMRFLADHLNGDVYFRIHRENHNLDRARTQFKLVADMEKKMDQMTAIVAKY